LHIGLEEFRQGLLIEARVSRVSNDADDGEIGRIGTYSYALAERVVPLEGLSRERVSIATRVAPAESRPSK